MINELNMSLKIANELSIKFGGYRFTPSLSIKKNFDMYGFKLETELAEIFINESKIRLDEDILLLSTSSKQKWSDAVWRNNDPKIFLLPLSSSVVSDFLAFDIFFCLVKYAICANFFSYVIY